MKYLNKNTFKALGGDVNLLNYPEKVLQFGTGVLLRGLVDYAIDNANKQGVFKGRIVVVKSTEQGNTDYFVKQDNLYTVCVKGIQDGKLVEENRINTSISRVLTANQDWSEILKIGHSDDLQLIISNTTEVGIVYKEENVLDRVPESFPGKLLAVLWERYKAGKNGVIIIPTELISENGDKLKVIVCKLAKYNKFEDTFIQWLEESNTFCNSLVDRIVPGAPKGKLKEAIANELPYIDDLSIIAEPYALWAISGNENVKNVLSFVQASKEAIVIEDIAPFKELKLRLLNGTHTLTCALAFFAGFNTVKDAFNNSDFEQFAKKLVFDELVPSIPYTLDFEEKIAFANSVIDRFKNPYIEHFWINITLNFTQKIEMRVLALLEQYYKLNNKVPRCIAAGFAGYLAFMKPEKIEDGKAFGLFKNDYYPIQDIKAIEFVNYYQGNSNQIVQKILSKSQYWGVDLTIYEGFAEAVSDYLTVLNSQGAQVLIEKIIK